MRHVPPTPPDDGRYIPQLGPGSERMSIGVVRRVVPNVRLNDGRAIPQLGLGVFKMGDDEARAAVVAAVEAGYRHIDTAAGYDNEAGVGRGITESGVPREELFITTKLKNDAHGTRPAREALERSLTRLGLDHVDLFLIHWPCPRQGRYVETWETLIDLRDEGLIESIGVSNFLAEHLDAIVDETGIVPAVNQIELHPTFQPDDLINHCSDLGIVVESWSPLGQARDLGHPEIVAIAEATGATPAQVIIAWHLHRGFVTIPKSTHRDRIHANFEAVQLVLESGQLEVIDGLGDGGRMGPDPATREP